MQADLRVIVIGSMGFVLDRGTLYVRVYDPAAGWKGAGRPTDHEWRAMRSKRKGSP